MTRVTDRLTTATILSTWHVDSGRRRLRLSRRVEVTYTRLHWEHADVSDN